ncbi:protein unc-93 homolog A isoform X5 [Lingula anatina]|uniref:Protein unc-93 homolog A isoform X5 n=1 Tax=Lingula anatina TaxID=7574 RepID=A0A1S3HAP0_LINAN|nr:protein unc-93 homolog A isoform X5 [Lingula anatina]|eukprot:XP_013382521.1 protein unc-93 homolog A isoform X5 [Lingula anatina]
MIPGALLFGILGTPIYAAQGYIVTTAAIQNAALTGRNEDEVISTFNGVFWSCFYTTQVSGNLLSTLVLQESEHNRNSERNSSLGNGSVGLGDRFFNRTQTQSVCSVHSCPDNWVMGHIHSETQSPRPEDHLVYILVGTYLGLVVIGMCITAFALKEQEVEHDVKATVHETKELLLATFTLMKDPNLFLMIPLYVFNGFHMIFLFSEFTKAFVACELGIEWVGYTMMCYGVTSAISPWVFGHLHKWIGFPINYTAAGIINMALFIQMLVYPVSKEHLGYFFFIPGIWGVLNGMWQSRTLALLGIHFSHNQRPAFANYHLWQGVGFTVSFAYGNLLCVATKIYICMTMLVLSLLLYYVVEIKTRLEKKKEKSGQVISDEKQNGNIPEAEKLSPNGIREDDVKKLALSSTSLPNELSIPFTQSDLYLYATDVNFLAASTGSMIARWDSMSRDQFRSVVKAKSKDSVHA